MENIIETIQNVAKKCKDLRMGDESLNIIDILRLEKNISETAHSRALKEFLSVGELYGYPLLKLFLSTVDLNALKSFTPTSFYCEKFNIDVLIMGKVEKENYAIIIENKINEAVDRETQIERYISTVKNFFNCKEENIYILYLVSGQGRLLPTDNSISPERRSILEERGQFITITYTEHIISFLDKVLTTWNNESIRSTAYQYQQYLKEIFGINDKEKGYIKMENDILYTKLKLESSNDKVQKLFDFLENLERTKESAYSMIRREILIKVMNSGYESKRIDDEIILKIPYLLEEELLSLTVYFGIYNENNKELLSYGLRQTEFILINYENIKIPSELDTKIRYFLHWFLIQCHTNEHWYSYEYTNEQKAIENLENYINTILFTRDWLELLNEYTAKGYVVDIQSSSKEFSIMSPSSVSAQIKFYSGIEGGFWFGIEFPDMIGQEEYIKDIEETLQKKYNREIHRQQCQDGLLLKLLSDKGKLLSDFKSMIPLVEKSKKISK